MQKVLAACLALCFVVALGGCKGGEGAKCAKPEDCAAGLTCIGYICESPEKLMIRECQAQVRKIANTLTTYYALEDDFPAKLEDLTSSGGRGKWLEPRALKDPWGTDLIYAYPSRRGDAEFDLCSAGPDRQAGSEDDICYGE